MRRGEARDRAEKTNAPHQRTRRHALGRYLFGESLASLRRLVASRRRRRFVRSWRGVSLFESSLAPSGYATFAEFRESPQLILTHLQFARERRRGLVEDPHDFDLVNRPGVAMSSRQLIKRVAVRRKRSAIRLPVMNDEAHEAAECRRR